MTATATKTRESEACPKRMLEGVGFGLRVT